MRVCWRRRLDTRFDALARETLSVAMFAVQNSGLNYP